MIMEYTLNHIFILNVLRFSSWPRIWFTLIYILCVLACACSFGSDSLKLHGVYSLPGIPWTEEASEL